MKIDARDGVLTRRVVSETETKCRVISRHVPRRRAVRATPLATISRARDVENIFRVPSGRARERGATREDVDGVVLEANRFCARKTRRRDVVAHRLTFGTAHLYIGRA